MKNQVLLDKICIQILSPFGSGSGSEPIIQIRIRILQKGSDPFGSGSGSTTLVCTGAEASEPTPPARVVYLLTVNGRALRQVLRKGEQSPVALVLVLVKTNSF